MPAKPLVLFACAGLLGGAALAPRTAHAAPPITLVLFPRTLSSDDDVKALVDVRKKLRTNTAYEVITYDPNSSAVKRAAAEANHPEWLSDPMGNDAERLALTRALGAAFSIIIAKADGRGKMDVRVDEAAASARTWSGYDEKADDADWFIRQQASFALANRVPSPAVPLSPPVVVGRVSVPATAPVKSAPLPLAPAAVSAPMPPAQAAAPTPAPSVSAAVPAPAPTASVPPAAVMPAAPTAAATVPPASPPPAAPPVPALAPVAKPLPVLPTPANVPLVPAPAVVPVPAAPASVPSTPAPVAAPVPVPATPAPVPVPNTPAPASPALTPPVPAPAATVPDTQSATPAPVSSAPVSSVPPVSRPLPQPPVRLSPAPPALPKRLPPVVSAPVQDAAPTVIVPVRSAPPAQIPSPVRVSAALPVQGKAEQTLVVPSPLPIPAPSQVVVAPAPPAAMRPDEDLVPVRSLLAQGDTALSAGNFVAAIAAYRDAINGAPLSMAPRLKLAQAYLQSDRRDKALSEAQRALALAPNDPAVQQFLMQLDAETGSSDGAVARFQAVAAQSPQDPNAHLELADALWNNGALSQAEDEYQTAQSLAGPHTPAARQAAAHLARLYAAQSRYVDSLAALAHAGAGGYALALGIVQSRADTLRSMLDAGLGSMDAGKTTHEAFYKTASDAAAQAQALADFVVKVTPPSAFRVSHLHRVLATHLMAQQAAVLVNYVETSDASFSGQAALLEKEAATEMLTAHAAEQKLGLWDTPHAEASN